ncbi:MAG TPA: hypothetical protein VFV98_15840 [Vicinamibacterales bacterium]|nr:hypothetical protein [Vicinamibacterales bacterium]
MSDERDDLLKEIGDLLGVEPSPSFAAGVRARIASESGHRRGWLTWFAWAGAAAAVAAGIAIFSISRRVDFSAPVPVTTAVATKAETPAVAAVETRAAAPATRLRPARQLPSVAAVFPTDERRALDALLRGLKAGRAFVPPAASQVDPVTGELLPLPPVEIPPLFPDEDGAIRNRTGRLPR